MGEKAGGNICTLLVNAFNCEALSFISVLCECKVSCSVIVICHNSVHTNSLSFSIFPICLPSRMSRTKRGGDKGKRKGKRIRIAMTGHKEHKTEIQEVTANHTKRHPERR
jgi:hypothetical protein